MTHVLRDAFIQGMEPILGTSFADIWDTSDEAWEKKMVVRRAQMAVCAEEGHDYTVSCWLSSYKCSRLNSMVQCDRCKFIYKDVLGKYGNEAEHANKGNPWVTI